MIAFVCTVALLGGLLVMASLRRPMPRRSHPIRVRVNPMPAVACLLAGTGAALIVTGVPAFAALCGILAACVPSVVRRRRARAQRWARAQSWPAVLDDMTSAVRAGLNLPEALAQAGGRAPTDLRDTFAHFDRQYRRTGDFAGSLQEMRGAIDDAVFDQLAQSLAIARSVGGSDLTSVLRSLGTFVRADVQIRGELAARQSWSVNAARMAVASPWIVLVLLSSRPSTIDAYRSGAGALVLLGVAALSAMAYALMLRIARLDGAHA